MENVEEYPSLVGFRAEKAAQIASYFATRSGGTIDKLKLIKLLYLSDRESAASRGRLMLNDQYYSLKDGPICSAALNGINGRADTKIWSAYVARNDRIVMATHALSRDDMDQVSDNDLAILERIWDQFGGMKSPEIRQYTHDNCPEYKEVTGKDSLPIYSEDIFRAVGRKNAPALADLIQERRFLERFFVS